MKATEADLAVCESGIDTFLATKPGQGTVSFCWLGQAGFTFRFAETLILLDPYLSDYLATKYRGKEFPHVRMMQSPIAPEVVRDVCAVLCTHRHSDHMDPGTLPVIAENNPECRFIVPAAEHEHAKSLGLPESRVLAVNDGDTFDLGHGIGGSCIPSAHEELETNEQGQHHFLGYVLNFGGLKVYHSGDCAPYEGLAGLLKPMEIALALLPVNGRDTYRRDRGIPGNMTFEEAVALCRDAGIPRLMPNHFGMFDFNTADPDELREKIRQLDEEIDCRLPSVNYFYVLSPQ